MTTVADFVQEIGSLSARLLSELTGAGRDAFAAKLEELRVQIGSDNNIAPVLVHLLKGSIVLSPEAEALLGQLNKIKVNALTPVH